jgi:NADH-quinone oxidoreductase subunit I
VRELVEALKNLVIGLLTTGKHLGRHAVTLQYPTQKWQMPERSRGIVVLLSDKETGELNCTACMLCMRACPSAAIKIEQHRDEETKKRVLDEFIVDNTICCFCGLCEEACNFAAVKLATKYEFSTLNKEDLIWNKAKLQEVGRDVPYEKPVKKKAAPKPAAGKTAKPDDSEDMGVKKPSATSADSGNEDSETKPKNESEPESRATEMKSSAAESNPPATKSDPSKSEEKPKNIQQERAENAGDNDHETSEDKK